MDGHLELVEIVEMTSLAFSLEALTMLHSLNVLLYSLENKVAVNHF